MLENKPPKDTSVSPLNGRMPRKCESDLINLRRFISSITAEEQPAEAVSPAAFQEVFLTGATGFIGRFLVRELLQQSERLSIHCLVRAGNIEEGLARVRDAMTVAEIWDDAYQDRLRILPGDLTLERFGLEEEVFNVLADRVDAVYHVAGRVSLAMSYSSARVYNVVGMRPVLQLCLRARRKHLYYISTLGIFPEYFARFTGRYESCRIEHHGQPDVREMMWLFPLGIAGYVWSKLVAEQCSLAAQAVGLPVAVFRLPNMTLASTGYTDPNNVEVRMVAASNQTGKIPQGFSQRISGEPAAAVAESIVAVSLNPDRRYTIYHCCDPDPSSEVLETADLGIYWKKVSYSTFKLACLAHGDSSPLNGLWPALDHFRQLWYERGSYPGRQPISDRSLREDCPRPIHWPARLVCNLRSYLWIWRNREAWPYPKAEICLDHNRLLERAQHYADTAGVSFEDAYPSESLEGLKQLVEALQRPEARMLPSGIREAVYILGHGLRVGAALERERLAHPEIVNHEVVRPIFIIGINRTGTTLLHRLMARDQRHWALRYYELAEPVLASGRYDKFASSKQDPRYTYRKELLESKDASDRFAGIHATEVDDPEEDLWLFMYRFLSWAYSTLYHIPQYYEWLLGTDSRPAYRMHRRFIQHFTWQRRQQDKGGQRCWLLKMPWHLMRFDTLVETYPDATFIQTHRDPAEVMGSWNSLVTQLRSRTMEPRPADETGAEQLARMSHMLNGATAFRAAHPELESRWIDVRFTDLVAGPIATVRDIYQEAGWPLTEEAVHAMRAWLLDQQEKRRKESRHQYSLSDYGLSAETVRDAFSPYLDFVAARGLM